MSQESRSHESTQHELQVVSTDSHLRQAAGTEPSPDGKAAAIHLADRLDRVERQNRRMKLMLLLVLAVVAYLAYLEFVPERLVVHQRLMESKELKLLDSAGNTRMFLRMYSRVPVLQLLDRNGKPRLSLGMRFDDTPFIDMSDETGRTRAAFEMNEKGEPTIRLYNEKGQPSFTIN